MKPIGVGWAKLPGTIVRFTRRRAILPTRMHREIGARGQRAGKPCPVHRRCGAGALPTLIWGLWSQASRWRGSGRAHYRTRLGAGFLRFGAAAARGAMRSAACRRGRYAQGLASGDLCSSLHHLISGRTALARTHIPHACGEEATRMGPIYETACLLAQGWHGHHPSRADRGMCRDADALVEAFTPLRP